MYSRILLFRGGFSAGLPSGRFLGFCSLPQPHASADPLPYPSHPPPPTLWLEDLALAMQCWLETLGRGAQAFVFLSTGLEEASLMLEGGSKGCQERAMEELSCLCFLREKWHSLTTVVRHKYCFQTTEVQVCGPRGGKQPTDRNWGSLTL